MNNVLLTFGKLLQLLELTGVENLCLLLYFVMFHHPLLQLLSRGETGHLRC